MLTDKLIQAYTEVLKSSFMHGESGIAVAIESAERHSDLALEAMKHLEQDMRSGKISIEEPDTEQLLDFVQTVYQLCIHEEGAPYHRRDLENLMRQLAADKSAKVS